jgi:hypothetical protein
MAQAAPRREIFFMSGYLVRRTRLAPGAEQNITFARLARLCDDPRFLPGPPFMDAFLVSTGIVALAEIGDKTQLLAFVLAARSRRPLPIVAGILVATIANHAFAAAVGALVSKLLGPDVMRWVPGLSFLAMAAWIMVPDEIEGRRDAAGRGAGLGFREADTRPAPPPCPGLYFTVNVTSSTRNDVASIESSTPSK